MSRKHRSESPETAGRDLTSRRGGAATEGLGGLVERVESFFENPWSMLGWASSFEPRLDLDQTAKELVVSARLPGFSAGDVSVDLTEDTITIRGRKTSEQKRRHGGEVSEESFVRSMTLPASIRAEGAKASFKDGKLEIRLPRAKEAQVRRLDVQG